MDGRALADLVKRDGSGGAARARGRQTEITSHATAAYCGFRSGRVENGVWADRASRRGTESALFDEGLCSGCSSFGYLIDGAEMTAGALAGR
jgi:hypothetical protein